MQTWIREAEAAIGVLARGRGAPLVEGRRSVLGVVNVPRAEDLDRALGGLPIIRETGPGVKTEALPIYDYRTFGANLNGGPCGG